MSTRFGISPRPEFLPLRLLYFQGCRVVGEAQTLHAALHPDLQFLAQPGRAVVRRSPQKRKGRGRPPIKGKRQKKLSAILRDRKVSWMRYRVSLWYGQNNRLVEIATGTALWYRSGVSPVSIRWLLVRDPTGELDPQAFLATDLNAHPRDILVWFVSRWQLEVTFEEVRAHLGVETQRQWSDKAILRTTPVLLGLFSIITLWANDLAKSRKLKPRIAAWYPKTVLTFSDAIAAVRREISAPSRMENAFAHAA